MLRRYELFVDDLPVWGFVGPPPEEGKESQGHIWTHKSFDIDYNDNRVRPRGFLIELHAQQQLSLLPAMGWTMTGVLDGDSFCMTCIGKKEDRLLPCADHPSESHFREPPED